MHTPQDGVLFTKHVVVRGRRQELVEGSTPEAVEASRSTRVLVVKLDKSLMCADVTVGLKVAA